jgi:DNA sulfur modification protein DndE
MKPPTETVRVNRQGRDQLTKLKRITRIEHWNSLCRIAVITSLREATVPPHSDSIGYDGGVEMSWKVFAGEFSEIFSACLYARAQKDGLTSSSEDAALTLRTHLHRGLGYLVADRDVRSISELCAYWFIDKGFTR